MSVQNEEELRNVWAVGWEACPSLLTGWGRGRVVGEGTLVEVVGEEGGGESRWGRAVSG